MRRPPIQTCVPTNPTRQNVHNFLKLWDRHHSSDVVVFQTQIFRFTPTMLAMLPCSATASYRSLLATTGGLRFPGKMDHPE